jgi:nucleoside-diphosphate-sugar epimerase
MKIIGENGMLGEAINKEMNRSNLSNNSDTTNFTLWAAGSINKILNIDQVEKEMQNFKEILDQSPKGKGSFFIFLSSAGSMYEINPEFPSNELSRISPMNTYGLMKLQQEELLLNNYRDKFGRIIILRLANVYGRKINEINKFGLIDKVIYSALNNAKLTISANLNSRRNYGHKSEYARAIIWILNNIEHVNFPEIMNLAPNFSYSIKEILEIASKHFETKLTIENISQGNLDTVLVNSAYKTLNENVLENAKWSTLDEYLKLNFRHRN